MQLKEHSLTGYTSPNFRLGLTCFYISKFSLHLTQPAR